MLVTGFTQRDSRITMGWWLMEAGKMSGEGESVGGLVSADCRREWYLWGLMTRWRTTHCTLSWCCLVDPSCCALVWLVWWSPWCVGCERDTQGRTEIQNPLSGNRKQNTGERRVHRGSTELWGFHKSPQEQPKQFISPQIQEQSYSPKVKSNYKSKLSVSSFRVQLSSKQTKSFFSKSHFSLIYTINQI